MVKRLISLLCVAVLIMGLAACVKVTSTEDYLESTKNTESKTEATKSESKSEKSTFAFTKKETESDKTEKETKESTKANEKSTEAPTEAKTEAPTKAKEYPYLVKVNRVYNTVTVYGKDGKGEYTEPLKAFVCSVGKYVPSNPNSEPTPLGTFSISDQYEWGLMLGNVYGRYACRVVSDILFHSVPYFGRDKGSLETDQYNLLGEEASLGCIRLNVRDAKWIFENCDPGTTVIVYEDESSPGPLGKPMTIRIPLDSPYAGWDPTDDDPSNPWNDFEAKIEGAEDLTLTVGAKEEELTKNVKAYDKCSNDITDYMVVSGKCDLNKAGTYEIMYSVTDATGSSDSKRVTVTVKEEEKP